MLNKALKLRDYTNHAVWASQYTPATQAVKGMVCKTIIHEFESRAGVQIKACWANWLSHYPFKVGIASSNLVHVIIKALTAITKLLIILRKLRREVRILT